MKKKLGVFFFFISILFTGCDKNENEKGSKSKVVHIEEIVITDNNVSISYDGYVNGRDATRAICYYSTYEPSIELDWRYVVIEFFKNNELVYDTKINNVEKPVYIFGTTLIDHYKPASTSNDVDITRTIPIEKGVPISDEEKMIGYTLKVTYYY